MPLPTLRRLALAPLLVLSLAAASFARAAAQSRPAPRPGLPNAIPAAPRAMPHDSVSYAERYRPQYHFTPAVHWMNDPNGLVFHDGEYHLFYQYNPFGNRWGHMSWGHAVSPDLVHWTHLPVAIPEADGVMAFSGSAVVDHENTSGFGRDGRPPLVAIYTGAREGNQAQYVAYSTDRGRTWTRYGPGPVLDVGSPEFRDPKVFWYAPERKWVMVVSLATEHRLRLYSSPDLKRWTAMSDFGPAGATGGVWECPDLFELPVDGRPGERKWVLIVNMNPGGIAGGSGAQYFVGRFDGTRFVADGAAPATADPAAPGVRWADYGNDFYAAVSWSDVPRADGRRLWIGWMNDWQYANDIPTSPWRSAQSVPRALGLVATPNGVELTQRPVRELEPLRGAPHTVAARDLAAGVTELAPMGIRGKAMEIVAEFAVPAGGAAGAAQEFGLKVRRGAHQETTIGVDLAAGTVFVDRTRSGDTTFHKDFGGRQQAPLPVIDGRVRLHLFVDWSSVELFAGDGRVVVTDQIFPDPASDGVALYAAGGGARLLSLTAWPVRSAWHTNTRSPAER